ncbi:MAG: aromatic ring-hydroxylating dioxygenase subunit alpha [Alphaproteobacteria bacterium]|nr:aromatic ring-hydroxylating dioxygenase subunit alpha [Alphaproteobacteria bacterium]
MTQVATAPTRPNADPDAGFSLPAWVYRDAEFYQAEMARVMRPSWQVVCHVNDIPAAGDYRMLGFLGESILVIRGDDGAVRALSNVCRHRGARIVDQAAGCVRKLNCPYHAWSYELDGRLSGVPLKETYPGLDMQRIALPRIESETWRGFVFVRLEGGGPGVAAMMAPYEDEIAPYRFEDMQAIGRVTLRPRTVNWKNIADNYSDNLHIRVAHPGLTRLFGKTYGSQAGEWADRLWGTLLDRPSENRSERMYQRVLPRLAHLPESHQRLWLYFKLWPNVAFDIYPDQIDFMQFLPVSPTETLIREISYALPDDRREMKAARYLNWRINRQVNAEDTVLVQRVQDGMESPNFTVGPLSEEEVCLRAFGAKLRSLIPEARLHHAPEPGWSRRRA